MTLYDLAIPAVFGFYEATTDKPGIPVVPADDLWDIRIRFPRLRAREAPRIQRQALSILSWTGWSVRTLAEFVESTHPTVSAVLAGRSTSFTRVPELPSKIAELHDLLDRLRVITENDSTELNRILRTPPSLGQPTSLDCFAAGDVTGAWLAAIDLLTPRRTGRMMRGLYPAPAGRATSMIDE